jgi:uroporphyrinogen-III synthase
MTLPPSRGRSHEREPAVLRGHSIVVARARPGRSTLADSLRALGAEVWELPRVERQLLAPPPALLHVLQGRRDGVVVVACDEAAHVVNRALAGADAMSPRLPPILAIGTGPASILAEGRVTPLAVTSGACDTALGELRAFVRDRRVLVATAERGRPALSDELERLGAYPELCVVATDVHVQGEWPLVADLVVLGASSAARALYGNAPTRILGWPAIAIGEHTENAARALGVRNVVRAREDTRTSVLETAMELLTRTPRPKAEREERRP